MGNYYLIKGNPERLKIESDRITSFLKEKYKNNEEFREKKKLYAKEYRVRKALEKLKLEETSKPEVLMPDLICG
jgi:two-component SAPR family response regulator